LGDPLVVARITHLIASALVAGTILFVHFVAEPVFRQKSAPPALVAWFGARTASLVWVSLAVALASGTAWLLILAAKIGGQSIADALTTDTASVLLTETTFGLIWQVRLVLAALLTAGLLLRARTPAGARLLGWFAVIVSACLVGSLAFVGHAGATPGSAGTLHAAADCLHAIAAGAWLGGLPALVLFIRPQRSMSNDDDPMIAADAVRRFSTLGIAAVGTLVASGAVNAWFLAGSIDALIQTDYGRLLSAKLALFLAMVCLAAVNRLRLMPRVAADNSSADRDSHAIRAIRRHALIELALGLGVFIIVGILGTIPPGGHVHEPGHDHLHTD